MPGRGGVQRRITERLARRAFRDPGEGGRQQSAVQQASSAAQTPALRGERAIGNDECTTADPVARNDLVV